MTSMNWISTRVPRILMSRIIMPYHLRKYSFKLVYLNDKLGSGNSYWNIIIFSSLFSQSPGHVLFFYIKFVNKWDMWVIVSSDSLSIFLPKKTNVHRKSNIECVCMGNRLRSLQHLVHQIWVLLSLKFTTPPVMCTIEWQRNVSCDQPWFRLPSNVGVGFVFGAGWKINKNNVSSL